MAQQPFPLDELSALFARMKGLLPARSAVDSAIQALARSLLETVPGADGAGISLLDGQGRKTSTGATDRLVEQADALQYKLGEGPCLTAWASQSVVRISDTGTEKRWPRWCAAAAVLGLRSTLSVPLLREPGDSIGAVKVYSALQHAFDEHAERRLLMFAVPAGVLLGHTRAVDAPQQFSAELKGALLSRESIAVATGILMERLHIGAAEATEELLAASHRQQEPVRLVADRIIAGGNVNS